MEGYDYSNQIMPEQGQQDQSRLGYQTAEFEAPAADTTHEVLPYNFIQVPRQYVEQQSTYDDALLGQPLQTSAFYQEAANTSAPPNSGMMSQQTTSFVPMTNDSPGLIFNGYRLEPSVKPIPEEFMRIPSGNSIAEPGSILDEESGRTYYNHHTGKYFFPNDAVSMIDLKERKNPCSGNYETYSFVV